MRFAPVLAAAALLVAAPAGAQAPQSPADVVKQVYRIAAGPKGDYQHCDQAEEVACTMDGPRIRALFSRSLAALIDEMNKRSEKNGDVILDFDPITDSQDPFVDRLSVTGAAPSGEAAEVAVRFYSAKGPKAPRHDLRYRLTREGGQWRIDDIEGLGADGWDLRKIAASDG